VIRTYCGVELEQVVFRAVLVQGRDDLYDAHRMLQTLFLGSNHGKLGNSI